MSDQYLSASKTPFKWYFAGGPTLARFFMFSFDVSFDVNQLLYFQIHIFGAQKSLHDETVLLSTKNLR